MKTLNRIASYLMLLAALALTGQVWAQRAEIQYFRPYDQTALQTFEPAKTDMTEFKGLDVRIGAGFTQQYQMLEHSNDASVVPAPGNEEINLNALYPLGAGFNLATANLYIDAQLDDGIRLAVESYMSSRHHSEFWVKGGYIQVDKLPMFGNPQWFTDKFRVKIGHMQINYGDQQFRRSDNGNTIYNPFVGNYIMDAFATEIGGEVYFFATPRVMLSAGMTSGLIKGDVRDYAPTDDGRIDKKPSVYFKLAYDDQVSEKVRFRVSGSLYNNSNSPRNTLYAGDRAGSRFYMAMEPEYYLNRRAGNALTASSEGANFTSGRLNPNLTGSITAWQINPFVKVGGLEFFGAYEQASGNSGREASDREFTQLAGELIYRFLPREQLYIGGRYNTVSGRLSGMDSDITIDRLEVAAGWFATKNLLLKASYVNQDYRDFPTDDYRAGGNFNGIIIEAAVGF